MSESVSVLTACDAESVSMLTAFCGGCDRECECVECM